jgi:hypothetical protein
MGVGKGFFVLRPTNFISLKLHPRLSAMQGVIILTDKTPCHMISVVTIAS